MDQQKLHLVPAFVIIEAESADRANEIACAVTETMNNLPHGHGYANLRLDEGMDTIEMPADFPGGSMLQVDGWNPDPGLVAGLTKALQRIAAGEEMAGSFTHADVVARYQQIAREALEWAGVVDAPC